MSKPKPVFSFIRGWSFHRGDISIRNYGASHAERFDASEWLKAGNNGISKPGYPEDSEWADVTLPHDFVIENDFDREANYVHGSLPVGIGWYRKEFVLPEDSGDGRVILEFDGVFRNSTVWLNGHFVGNHLSGYTGLSYDITEVCEPGEVNAVAVRVDASEFELWSYEGGGIYRDVRLVLTGETRVATNGVYLRTTFDESFETSAVKVGVDVSVEVENKLYDDTTGAAVCTVLDPDGEIVAEAECELAIKGNGQTTIDFDMEVRAPVLWNLEKPSLYEAHILLTVDDVVVDEYHQPFGIRHIRFDPDTGFYLNGKNIKLKGTCCHQDHAGVGIAVPAALQEWRVRKLKEMGSNAIRTSHNPPDPALLDACDRLGMLVVDEQRIIGTSTEVLGQLENLVRRDRNHPSVILWCLGNEEIIQHSKVGINIFRRMQDLVHRLDTSRPTTYAMNAQWIDTSDFHADQGFRFDVFGANYRSGQRSENYDDFHSKHPDWPLVGTETGGSTSTRGLYTNEQRGNYRLEIGNYGPCNNIQWTNPKRRGCVSSYGETCTPWGYSVEETWKDCNSRPYLSGTFLWTGFDYRGETFPYQWPSVITRFGISDLCGFPKDAYFYLRAWWKPDAPMVHLFPHWDWHGYEGEAIEVWCYSNCSEVELFVNGKSQGRKKMERDGHLEWNPAYTPGTLEAIGYDGDGNAIAEKKLRTPGRPASVQLSSDSKTCRADGEDVVVVNATIVDVDGEWCQNASNDVAFQVTLHAEIIGVGNGDPVSLESDKDTTRMAYRGLCQVILRSTGVVGTLSVTAESSALNVGGLEIEATPCDPRLEIGRSGEIIRVKTSVGEIDNLL